MKLPQLTLRDLFWLVLVVGMGVGWWLETMRHRRREQELTNDARAFAYFVLAYGGGMGRDDGSAQSWRIRELLDQYDPTSGGAVDVYGDGRTVYQYAREKLEKDAKQE